MTSLRCLAATGSFALVLALASGPTGQAQAALVPSAEIQSDDPVYGPAWSRLPAVAFGGARGLVVWRDVQNWNVYGARIGRDLVPLDHSGMLLGPGGSLIVPIDVACTAAQCL